MSELQIILTIFAVACAVWQMSIVAMGVAMMKSGKYRNVTIGPLPGILAIVFAIAAVLA